EFSSSEAQYRCRKVLDDLIFNPVEIRPVGFPVIRIAKTGPKRNYFSGGFCISTGNFLGRSRKNWLFQQVSYRPLWQHESPFRPPNRSLTAAPGGVEALADTAQQGSFRYDKFTTLSRHRRRGGGELAMTEDGIGVPLRRREDRRFLTG